MSNIALITVICPDRPGLVAGITGCLFDLGANLADTNFSVLGTGAEFTSVCELPPGISLGTVEEALRAHPDMEAAEISVRSFTMDPERRPEGEVTHQIVVAGGDQPGLVARLCETFQQFRANIVVLYAGRSDARQQDSYVIRLYVWIPPDSADACIATVVNTAEHLQLTCRWTAV